MQIKQIKQVYPKWECKVTIIINKLSEIVNNMHNNENKKKHFNSFINDELSTTHNIYN